VTTEHGDPRDPLRELPLREYRPRSRLRVGTHTVPRARYPAVDAHNHLGTWLSHMVSPEPGWVVRDVGELLATMDASNVRSIVNADGRWGEELEANLDRYDRAHPGRFATLCHLNWREVGAGGEWVPRLRESLRRSAGGGAAGVKVWKDLGLHVRDPAGELLLPDDARLDPVWDDAGSLGLPVLIHVADPMAFFEPVDETNERLEELLAHPEWSFADERRYPRFQRLIEALERVVARHPGTTFVGAHVGCFAEDLAWVGRMLAAHPNFHVDIAARIAELGRQPRAATSLIERFPDRVLFGTDSFPPTARAYALAFRFLETLDESFPYSEEEPPPQGRWTISGLGLRDDVLRAVEGRNAARIYRGLDG
jgi:predicted TIM-barrel fold metal-dependent hydrolase